VARLRPFRPDELDDAQRAVYDQVAGGRRAAGPQAFRLRNDDGTLTGPFDLFLHAPTVGAAFSGVGEAIRYGTGLSARIRELAILAVSGHHGCAFERYAHERVARQIGMLDAEIAGALALDDLDLADPAEAAAYAFSRQVLQRRSVGDALYAEAVARLGEEQVVELTALVGYYEALALLLDVFEVGVPEQED
jgi:4-carboxymuconolactone decarboxylase